MVAVSLKKKIFFKQKTAYEIGGSDWSSDVCSSDLTQVVLDEADEILNMVFYKYVRHIIGGDELFELGALDGQHGLACGAQDLVDEGQSQHGGAGDGGSGDGAGGDMCVHGVSFLPVRPGGQSWMGRALARLYSSVPVPLQIGRASCRERVCKQV